MVDRARLEGLIQELLPEALRWLERMVAVNSFTGNRAGVNALGRLTEECFAGMGFVAERIPAGNAAWGDHLVLRRGRNAGVSVAMITHLDTVFPPEEELRNGFHWRRAGDWVYGPGTNDIKGGTVVAWMTLAALWRGEPRLFEAVDWSLFCNAAEETFAIDFGNLVKERLTRTTLAALVFEGEGREGAARRMVVARKGRGTWRMTVSGRGAHSGGDHRRGANAIVQAGELAGRIAGWTDYNRELTFNVGRIEGGAGLNRVPHAAIVEGEFRAFQPEVFEAARKALLALSGPGNVRAPATGHPCEVRMEVSSETRPWPRNSETDRIFATWQEAGRSLGQEVLPEERGGLSDANLVWDAVPTLDGLGPWGDNAHCSEWSDDGSKRPEFVDLGSFCPKALLNAVAVQNLLEQAGLRTA